MRSRTLLLAAATLPSSLAVTLYDFKPRADNVPAACDFVYKSTVSGCSATDFTSGNTCSSSCIFGLNVIRDQVVKYCFGVTGNSILVNMLTGTGVHDLCPNAPLPSTASTAAATTSSAPATSTVAKTTTATTGSSKTDSTSGSKTATAVSSSASSGSTNAVSTATLIPVAGSTGTTATVSGTTSATSSGASSTSTNHGGSNGSPFVFGPDSLEPGVKSGGAARRDTLSGSSFALAAFMLGLVGLL